MTVKELIEWLSELDAAGELEVIVYDPFIQSQLEIELVEKAGGRIEIQTGGYAVCTWPKPKDVA